MAQIQVRRGTKANLTTHGALAAGEIGFTTDEKLVYVGDGSSNYLVGRVASGSGDPSGNLIAGTIYQNTTSHKLFFCDGSAWAEVQAGAIINDSGTGATDLWSAQKIQSALNSAMVGIGEFQNSVKDKDLATPPGSPSAGDRYIIAANPTDAWADKATQIAQYPSSGSTWLFNAATEGMAAYVDDEDLMYIFNGSAWVAIGSVSLASSEPAAIAGASSGAVGDASTAARGNHSHDLSIEDNYVTTSMMAHGTRGDILTYNGSGGPPTLLAAGTTGYVLTASGATSDVAWAEPTVADNAVTLAKMAHATEQGSIIAYQGAQFTPTELAHGTAGQVLLSGGHGADVSWGDVDGGTFV